MATPIFTEEFPPRLLSTREIARRIPVSFSVLSFAVRAGKVVPDFQSSGAQLFRPERVEDVRQSMGRGLVKVF